MLVGREGKLDSMEKNWSSAGAKFVVVYGNHKSGKTSVLSEFSENKRGILFSAEHLNSFMNLRLFEKAVSEFSGEEEDFPTWKVAFKRIADFAKDERFLLAIDDFADLVFKTERFLKIFAMPLKTNGETAIFLLLPAAEGFSLQKPKSLRKTPLRRCAAR